MGLAVPCVPAGIYGEGCLAVPSKVLLGWWCCVWPWADIGRDCTNTWLRVAAALVWSETAWFQVGQGLRSSKFARPCFCPLHVQTWREHSSGLVRAWCSPCAFAARLKACAKHAMWMIWEWFALA